MLEHDKKNYNALVFLAVSQEESGELNDSLATYKVAAETEPHQLLAWQGLRRFYEKSRLPVHKKALESVYFKLIELHDRYLHIP